MVLFFISGRSLLAKVPHPLALPQASEAGNLSRSLLALSNGTKQRGALIISPIFLSLFTFNSILFQKSFRTQNMTSTSAQILAIPDTGETSGLYSRLLEGNFLPLLKARRRHPNQIFTSHCVRPENI